MKTKRCPYCASCSSRGREKDFYVKETNCICFGSGRIPDTEETEEEPKTIRRNSYWKNMEPI